MPVPYNKSTPTANVVLIDPVTLEPYSAGGSGSTTTINGVNGSTAATNANPLPVQTGALSATTNDRSGTATTTSGAFFVAANTNRRELVGQNESTTLTIYFNEFNGTAAAATAGSYTVPPLTGFRVSTKNRVNFVSPGGSAPVTMTESE